MVKYTVYSSTAIELSDLTFCGYAQILYVNS